MASPPHMLLLAAIMAVTIPAASQAPAPETLDQIGQVSFEGRVSPYRIRNLPVSSFPDLPPAIAAALVSRGCIIPQTFEAKRPENVIHGSFERPGSRDWAVLCAVDGKISLLVFFASASVEDPAVLESVAWQQRLAPHGGELGFDWGIDPASPSRVHDAEASLRPRPLAPDHDSVADTTIDRGTVYHLYKSGAWQSVAVPAE